MANGRTGSVGGRLQSGTVLYGEQERESPLSSPKRWVMGGREAAVCINQTREVSKD